MHDVATHHTPHGAPRGLARSSRRARRVVQLRRDRTYGQDDRGRWCKRVEEIVTKDVQIKSFRENGKRTLRPTGHAHSPVPGTRVVPA